MGKLDSLKIDDCPFAFASFAAKHNALVELLGSMVGENGISVVMAEKNAIIRANIAAGPAGNIANTNVANVVTSDGTLRSAYVAGSTTSAFPTHLQTGPDGSNNRSIMTPTEVGWSKSDLSSYAILYNDGMAMVKPGFSLSLAFADITSSMSIRAWNVCANGAPGTALFVSSVPA